MSLPSGLLLLDVIFAIIICLPTTFCGSTPGFGAFHLQTHWKNKRPWRLCNQSPRTKEVFTVAQTMQKKKCSKRCVIWRWNCRVRGTLSFRSRSFRSRSLTLSFSFLLSCRASLTGLVWNCLQRLASVAVRSVKVSVTRVKPDPQNNSEEMPIDFSAIAHNNVQLNSYVIWSQKRLPTGIFAVWERAKH
jgi:hypothetical protein